jgi:hypothetical protein
MSISRPRNFRGREIISSVSQPAGLGLKNARNEYKDFHSHNSIKHRAGHRSTHAML